MQMLLHFLYTVVAILFANALFQTLESAGSISGIAYIVYAIVKCVIFLFIIAASVAIFRVKFKQGQEKTAKTAVLPNLQQETTARNIQEMIVWKLIQEKSYRHFVRNIR